MKAGTIVITKKDLIFFDGSVSFKKGKEYKVLNDCNSLEKATLIDEQGEPHSPGDWFTKFKIKS